MAIEDNYYVRLGVGRNAQKGEIDLAYETALEKLDSVRYLNNKHALVHSKEGMFYTEAYDNLTNPQLRAFHDRYLNEKEIMDKEKEEAQRLASEASANGTNVPQQPYTFGNFDQVEVEWDKYSWANRPFNGIKEKLKMPVLKIRKTALFLLVYLTLNLIVLAMYRSYAENLTAPLWIFPIMLVHAIIVLLIVRSRNEEHMVGILIASGVFTACVLLWIWVSKESRADAPIALTVMLILTCTSGIPTAMYLHNVKNKHYVPKFPKRSILESFQWGTAGDLEDAIFKFGKENIVKGTAGELYTEHLFQAFKVVPGVRAFHGLRFIRSANADVDHAIISGNNLIFVDSKQWSKGDYSWNDDGTINQVKPNGDIQLRESHFTEAIKGYKRILPKTLNIYALILVHGTDISVSKEVRPRTPWVRMSNTTDGIDFLGSLLTQNVNGELEVQVIDTLRRHLKH